MPYNQTHKILFTTFLTFIFCFSIESQEIDCGTDVSSIEQQQSTKHAKGAKRFLKTTGKILYAPFKFRGESDPSIADMDAVEQFFLDNSYGQYKLTTTIAPIIELPFTRQEDKDDNTINWESTLRTELQNRGFNSSDFNYYIRRTHSGAPFVTISTAYGGGGGRISMINNSVWITCHEIGHQLYTGVGYSGSLLSHANFWKANNSANVIGSGTSVEYGNKFSVMGSGLRHLSLPHKINLEWIRPDDYYTVTNNGTFRIYPHDRGLKQADRKYAIKINKKGKPYGDDWADEYYYVAYKNNSGVSEANDGVLLIPFFGTKTQLLDNNPGSNQGYKDAPLAVGKTFRDNSAGITLEVLAKGGTEVNAWMDVKITFDDPNSTEKPAEVSFNTPVNGQSFNVGSDIPVEIIANQPGVDNYRVTLDIEGIQFPVTFTTPPYSYTIEDLSAGTHMLKATVYKGSYGSSVATYKFITINVGDTTQGNGDSDISLNVYPNPVSDKATISYFSLKEITDISLFDIAGRRVKVISEEALPSGENHLNLDVNALSSGVYVLQLAEGDNTHYKKIVVER